MTDTQLCDQQSEEQWLDVLYGAIREGMSKEQIKRRFGGVHIYIPKHTDRARDEQIRSLRNDGVGVSALVIRFGLSKSRIYEILRG